MPVNASTATSSSRRRVSSRKVARCSASERYAPNASSNARSRSVNAAPAETTQMAPAVRPSSRSGAYIADGEIVSMRASPPPRMAIACGSSIASSQLRIAERVRR